MTKPETLLKQGFNAAIQAAQAHQLAAFLPTPPKGRTVVIGMGKAGAAMAQAFEQHWQGDWNHTQGLIAVPYHSRLPTQYIELIECAHPIPDLNSQLAAQRLLDLVQPLGADDLVICLISGGGSALVSLPATGLDLAEKQRLTQQLLHSGASIHEINTLRRHLSAIKGGHLALACAPAPIINLIISDVPGDAPHQIASGPTVADPSTCSEALAIIDHYGLQVCPTIRQALDQQQWETLKPSHPFVSSVSTHLIATPQRSLQAAAQLFEQAGYNTLLLGDHIEGEAQEVAKVIAGIAHSITKHAAPIPTPAIIVSGGETSVRVQGTGKGGRNVEFLLALLYATRDQLPLTALAADTDGIDGACAVAGAFITPQTWSKALNLGLNPAEYLKNNDAHRFFAKIQQQIITGPTHTNVNDFRAVLIH